jgi:hypothetical protein
MVNGTRISYLASGSRRIGQINVGRNSVAGGQLIPHILIEVKHSRTPLHKTRRGERRHETSIHGELKKISNSIHTHKRAKKNTLTTAKPC